jgi:S1-C subfamily serine protease
MEIVTVEPDGPAARAGLQRGDLVAGADGIVIAGIDDLHRHLASCEPGQEVVLTVLRWKQKLELKALPGEAASAARE